MPVRVVVDVHERERLPLDALRRLGVETERRRLEVGDYLAGVTLTVRKTARDLNARFRPRIGRPSRVGWTPFPLVEGDDLDDGHLGSSSVRGARLAVSELGIGVIRSHAPDDSALWLALLARRPLRRRPRRVYAYRRNADPGIAVLAGAPGISTAIASPLLDRFGSVADLVAAGPEQWLSVEGVGRKRARALWEALAARHSPS